MRRKKTMKRWKIRKYYQLKDYWDVLAGSDVEETFYGSIIANFPMSSFNPNASGSNFKNYKNVFYWNGDGIPARWKFLQVFHDCFQQITTRHHEDIIFAIDEDEDTEENRKKVFIQFVLSFHRLIVVQLQPLIQHFPQSTSFLL